MNKFFFRLVYEDGKPDPAPAPTPKTFTQDEVNAFVSAENKKHQARLAETVKQLEELKNNAKLTQEERDSLAAKIEELNTQHMSKEQLLEREKQKAVTLAQEEIKKKDEEGQLWRNRYTSTLVSNTIISAAAEAKAYSTQQMLEILGSKAKIVEKLGEDGKGSGEFDVMIKFNDTDAKTKKPITLELSVSDAIKRMKELPDQYGNLFKAEGSGGLGGSRQPGASGGPVGFSKDMSTEQYMAWRKSQGFDKASPGVI